MHLLRLEPADVLALDEHLLAINKPRGWPTQGRAALGGDSVYAAALRMLEVDRLWPVHWLDRVTSGVLVFARNKQAAASLSAQFEARTVRKTYLAWVHGVPEPGSGRIDLPLTREGGRPRVDPEEGKPASTRYRVLRSVSFGSRDPNDLPVRQPELGSGGSGSVAGVASLLHLRPFTGRTHQLRVHLAAIGHPILGDPIHGRRDEAWPCLLHAVEIRLRHPADARDLRIRACPRDGLSLSGPMI